ncbi:MAG: PL29 family lyase N-terminal domain-containing protein [Bacteroidales bacterium]|nr:hypothetical protein [Candidatus Cryptobacteroides onthequi]MCQ2164552.1 PL29 family lyase N-terminal domain-containing protein [Bacteroidales bacterium]
MKKSLLIMALAAMAAGISCTDLSEVEGRIDNLETQVSGINSALKTIQDNLKNNVYVSKVESSADGYTIYFTNGTTATIRNGAKGDKGDTGAAGAAGAQGEKGETGAPGKDGDSLFASVEVKDGFVNLTLADGSVIVLPMAPSTVGMINSMTFVSEYNDGKATIECTSPEAATVKLGYLVGPQAAAVALKEKIESKDVTVNVWAAPVQTRSTVENAILLDVVSVAFEGAYMTIVADASDALKLGEVSLLVQFIGEGTDYYSPMVPAVKEVRYITYAGETYGFAKMKDGKTWMTENLRYIPEGMTPCNSLTNVAGGIYYPVVVNADKTAAAFGTAEDAKTQGYLYQTEVALGLSVNAITSEEQAKALEGTRGICPEGWHIPTIADITGLVGKAVSPIVTNTAAPYYNGANGSILMLKEDGLDMMPCGAVSVVDNTKTSATLMGFLKNYYTITSGYIIGSSYAGISYKTANDATSGIKNVQFWGMMPMANKLAEADFTCNGSKLSYKIAASVRCVKD